MSKAQEPLAYLVTGGRTYADRPFKHIYHAEASVAERKDGAKIIPLYAAPASSEQQAAQQHADTISLPRKEWEELQYYLDRCYDKGHLEQCFDLVEPLEALNAAIAARASNGGK